jgi:hypothetical protein
MKIELATKVAKLLNSWYLRVPNGDAVIDDWSSLVKRWLRHHGNLDTIARIKAIRLMVTKYLSGQPLPESVHPSVGQFQDGLPRAGKIVDLILLGEPHHLRLALTLLGWSRLIKGWKRPDLSPITATSTFVKSPEMEREVKAVVTANKWKVGVPIWERPHLSTKMGPNGLALIGSISDLCFLTSEMLTDISTLTGGSVNALIDAIPLWLFDVWMALFPHSPSGRVRKLSYVRDKEAKCRIVAILDYWSQSALLPLHRAVMGLLKGIRGDCTFNQGSFRRSLPRTGVFHSIDLSNATDRFPAVLLETVVAATTGSAEYASAWLRLLTSHSFYVPWEDREVKYLAGQPMGAYSSWAVFSLGHHIVVRIAARRAGKTYQWAGYALLGDDIVISDSDVAREYLNLLCELGVETSPSKTHTSDRMYEFAKRWIYKSEEVTGAPLANFLSGTRYMHLALAVRELEERWLPPFYTLVSRSLFAEIVKLYGRSPDVVKRLSDKAFTFFNLPIKGEPKVRRVEKARLAVYRLLGEEIGCFDGPGRVLQPYYTFLATARIRSLREAIKRQVSLVNDYLMKLLSQEALVPTGMDAQSVLTLLLPVQVMLQTARDLQSDVNRFGVAYREGRHESVVCAESAHIGIDPERLVVTRASHLVLQSSAASLNLAKMTVAGYLVDRHAARTLPYEIAESIPSIQAWMLGRPI